MRDAATTQRRTQKRISAHLKAGGRMQYEAQRPAAQAPWSSPRGSMPSMVRHCFRTQVFSLFFFVRWFTSTVPIFCGSPPQFTQYTRHRTVCAARSKNATRRGIFALEPCLHCELLLLAIHSVLFSLSSPHCIALIYSPILRFSSVLLRL